MLPTHAINHGLPWWRLPMETFFALLAICAGNSPVTGEFPAQRPVTRSFDDWFDLRLINGWVNNGETSDFRRHRAHFDVIVMLSAYHPQRFTDSIWHMKRFICWHIIWSIYQHFSCWTYSRKYQNGLLRCSIHFLTLKWHRKLKTSQCGKQNLLNLLA